MLFGDLSDFLSDLPDYRLIITTSWNKDTYIVWSMKSVRSSWIIKARSCSCCTTHSAGRKSESRSVTETPENETKTPRHDRTILIMSDTTYLIVDDRVEMIQMLFQHETAPPVRWWVSARNRFERWLSINDHFFLGESTEYRRKLDPNSYRSLIRSLCDLSDDLESCK